MVKNIVILLFLCLIPCAASAEFKLPETGQTKCYQAVEPYAEIPCDNTGQDGAYTINPMSYTDNGNGTVTDNNTGLMWQKCSVGQNNDSTCSGSAAAFNWYQASGTYDATYNASSQNACGSVNLGGQTDWRLPMKKELMSIVDYSVPYPGPTIKATLFPNTSAFNYWSSTTIVDSPNRAWSVAFYDGYVNYHDIYYYSYYVRCVRGGP